MQICTPPLSTKSKATHARNYNEDIGKQRMASLPWAASLVLHVVVNTATTSSWILHLATTALKETSWTSLLAQGRIHIGPVWTTCLSLDQPIEAKCGGNMYCSHPYPIQSLLLFYVPHSTHHKLSLFYLLVSIICLPDWHVNSMSRHILTCSPLYLQHQNNTLVHESFSINTSKLTHHKPSQKSNHI